MSSHSPLHLIEFPADDPARARKFWAEVLGVEFVDRSGNEGTGWQTAGDAPKLGVHARGRGPGDTQSLPYFEVDDLATALERVQESGGEVIHPGARWAVCRDSEGSPFGLAAATTQALVVEARNVLGGPLAPCGLDPVTGFFRDGCCHTGPEDVGSHTVCAVVTAEFLEHQRVIGNDLITPRPEYRFPGLVPGDRWCVTAANWLQAHLDGAAAYVVLASTHQRALEVIPLDALQEHAVDVPSDPGSLQA